MFANTKQTLMKKLVLGAMALTLLATSCKKDSNAAITEQSLAGNYTWISITAKAGTAPEQDIMDSYLDDCQKDDVTNLKTDGTFIVTDAGVTCTNTGPQSGTWNLDNATTFDMDGDKYTIVKFDGSTLHLSQTDNSMGMSMTINFKLKKQ